MYMQYVGDKQVGKFLTKIFIDITWSVLPNTFDLVPRTNYTFRPIHPDEFPKWRDHYACSGRLVATPYGDVYEISEEHRDAYPMHLPGFERINQLELGEVIPRNGFTDPKCLSAGDVQIMEGSVKFYTYRRTFLNK